jgi:hypothetical protein
VQRGAGFESLEVIATVAIVAAVVTVGAEERLQMGEVHSTQHGAALHMRQSSRDETHSPAAEGVCGPVVALRLESLAEGTEPVPVDSADRSAASNRTHGRRTTTRGVQTGVHVVPPFRLGRLRAHGG